MEWTIAAFIGLVALNYTFMRNFKADVSKKIDHMDQRVAEMDAKVFFLATGRTLEAAILENQNKKPKAT